MIKNDLILKYVEQLAKVIARILSLINYNKKEEALAIIDGLLPELEKENIAEEYLEPLADLKKIKGELNTDKKLLEEALSLYEKVNQKTKTFSFERAQKIEEIKELLNHINI